MTAEELRGKLHDVMRENCGVHEFTSDECRPCSKRVEGILAVLQEGKERRMKKKTLDAKPIDLPDIPTKMSKKDKKRHRKLNKQIGFKGLGASRMYRRIQEDREDAWIKTVRIFEATPDSFYNAWQYLNRHPAFWLFVHHPGAPAPEVHEMNLETEFGMPDGIQVSVVRVDPATNEISDDPALNTRVRIWYELSTTSWPTDGNFPHRYHTWRVDGGAATYEKAIVKGAKKVHTLYGNDRRILDGENTPQPASLQEAQEVVLSTEEQEMLTGIARATAERPSLVTIPITTRTPGKWRFVDTETQEVWRWDTAADGFKRMDPQADAEALALMASPDFQESLEQLRRGEVHPTDLLKDCGE
jgi:hypothetical protein